MITFPYDTTVDICIVCGRDTSPGELYRPECLGDHHGARHVPNQWTCKTCILLCIGHYAFTFDGKNLLQTARPERYFHG